MIQNESKEVQFIQLCSGSKSKRVLKILILIVRKSHFLYASISEIIMPKSGHALIRCIICTLFWIVNKVPNDLFWMQFASSMLHLTLISPSLFHAFYFYFGYYICWTEIELCISRSRDSVTSIRLDFIVKVWEELNIEHSQMFS